MTILLELLVMFIGVSEGVSNIYRIPTPTNTGDKVILVNFFGQPGIQVLHVNSNYTDVKIPRKYNSTFIRLGIYKNKTDIHILNKQYYYSTNRLRITESKDRSTNYMLEAENNDIRDFEEDDNYFTAPFRGFFDYKSIVDYLKYITKRFSANVHLITLGTTLRNRTIYGVIIKSGVTNSTSVFIEGGTIAREWISITMALYVIKEIASNISAYPIIKNLEWIIVPVVNPDGYEFSYRNPRVLGNCYKKCIGASLAPCSSLYLGPSALSERESRSIQSIMMAYRHTLKLYIGLRSFGNYILYPWGLKAEEMFDAAELIRAAQAAADAMYETHKGKFENYTVGNYAKIKYPAAGNMMDFARGVINIKYSYIIYLRGNGHGEKGYTPESTEIYHIISECFQGIKSLAEHVNFHYPPSKGNLRQKRNKRKRHLNSACSIVINPALFLLIYTLQNVKYSQMYKCFANFMEEFKLKI